MGESSEVVIIGGGAAGCAVAYYLAMAGLSATTIEGEGIGSKASGYSAGGLNPLQGAGIPGPLGPLAMASFRLHQALWEQLKGESGVDFGARPNSTVKLAFTESDLPELKETLAVFNAADGFSALWLEANEVRRLEPKVAKDVLQGLLTRGNAALDSYLFTRALCRAAEKRGTRLRLGSVRGMNKSGGRVTGLLLKDGEVSCDAVVVATGPWSAEVGRWLGVPVPVEPLKGEILRMRLPGPPLAYDFSWEHASLFHRAGGLVWVGTTEENRGFDLQPREATRRSLMEGAAKLMPAMGEAKLVKHTACLRPVTPDWLPILGRAPGWDNVYLATGAGKKGILLSPAMGKAIADLITHGETELEIDPCAPDRFLGVPG